MIELAIVGFGGLCLLLGLCVGWWVVHQHYVPPLHAKIDALSRKMLEAKTQNFLATMHNEELATICTWIYDQRGWYHSACGANHDKGTADVSMLHGCPRCKLPIRLTQRKSGSIRPQPKPNETEL